MDFRDSGEDVSLGLMLTSHQKVFDISELFL